MGVGHPGLEEEVEHAGEHRVADVAVEPRHCPGVDLAAQARTHHEVGAVLERLDEARDLGEVVGLVGVAHHDVLAAGGCEAGEVGAAVTLALLVDHPGARLAREVGRAVGGAVVGHDHLATDPV